MQAKVLDTVVNLKHQSNIKTTYCLFPIGRTRIKRMSTPQYQQQHQRQSRRTNEKQIREGEKQQNKQQQSISQEQKLQHHQKRRIKKDTVHRKP